MSSTEQLPRPDERPRRRLRAPARRPVRGAAERAERTLGAIAEGRLGTLPVSLSFWDGSVLPAPDPDSFYVFQLVGLDAIDEDGAPLGRVVEVHPGAANDNVELHDGRLVPLVEDAVREIDIEGGKLVVVRSFLL